MARGPHTRQHPIRDAWMDFLFGNPRRTLWIMLGVVVFFSIIFPHSASTVYLYVANALIVAFGPLVSALLQFAVACFGIWMMLKPWRPQKKKKDHP